MSVQQLSSFYSEHGAPGLVKKRRPVVHGIGSDVPPGGFGLGAGIDPSTKAGIDYLAGMWGKTPAAYAPRTDAQLAASAAGDVHAQIDPIIAQLRASSASTTAGGTAAIQGYGDTLQSRLAPLATDVGTAYGAADADLKAAGEGLKAQLGTDVAGAGDALRASLTKAGLPPAAIDAAVAKASGPSGVNELAASGFSDLAQNIGNRAADLGYFKSLPALAGLQTGQNIASFTGTQGKTLQDQIGQVEGAAPGLISTLLGRLQDNELTKVGAVDQRKTGLASLVGSFLTHANDNALTKSEGALDRNAQVKIAADTLGLNLSKAGAPDFFSGGKYGSFAYDPTTNTVSQVVPPSTDAGGNTPAAIKSAASAVASIAAKDSIHSVTTEEPVPNGFPGQTVKKSTRVKLVRGSQAYYEAIHKAEARIAPLLPGMSPQDVTAFVQKIVDPYFRAAPKG